MSRPFLSRLAWSLVALATILLVAVAAARRIESKSAQAPASAEAPVSVGAPASAAPDVPVAAPFEADAVDEAARDLPRLHSLLISRRGELIFERYYRGARADRAANIKSASKSVISALVGIAVDRGSIPSVTTSIVTFFPALARDPDPRKRAITIEDLLTMRSGLEGTSNRNYGAWVLSRNWVQHALARPMFAEPGAVMDYSTGNTHLLSAILTKISGTSTWQFANDVLARPLGFTLQQWPRDPQGIYFGGNDMLMTPRQLVAFGALYLNKGQAQGRQVVPEPWVERSCEGRRREFRPGDRRLNPNRDGGPGVNPNRGFDPTRDRRYGLGWWVYEIDGYETCFAWGYGGQYVFVVPALDLVIVTTASSDVSEERHGHRRLLFDIVSRLVVRPLASGDSNLRSPSPRS
jgi:CubicO group peptidase (beta-lactamase class C family)